MAGSTSVQHGSMVSLEKSSKNSKTLNVSYSVKVENGWSAEKLVDTDSVLQAMVSLQGCGEQLAREGIEDRDTIDERVWHWITDNYDWRNESVEEDGSAVRRAWRETNNADE